MIIVEGPDGAGKTTLVHELARRFGLQVGPRGTKDRSKLYTVTRQDTYAALAHSVNGTSPVYIWDRLFFSELVYAPVIGGRPIAFNVREQEFIFRVIQALECPIIVCQPPLAVVKANVRKVDQMAGVNLHINDLYAAYDELIFPEQAVHYDYTGTLEFPMSFEAICELVERYLLERRERML